MNDQTTVLRSDPSAGTASTFSDLSPEIRDGLYRRLGAVALLYSGTWIATFIYYRTASLAVEDAGDGTFWIAMTLLCTGLGIAVYLLCRTRRIPPGRFWVVATVFEVGAAVGICAGFFGWEQHGVEYLGRIATAFGRDPSDLATSVVAPLDAVKIRTIYHEGVTWVGGWLIVFPLIVPFSMMRTVVAAFLTASAVPAVMLFSVAVHGMPDAMSSWGTAYILDATIPTYIHAGIAVFGSRVVYRLTRELNEARRMGSYQLVERIGAGGMGEVWKAKHRLLARPAAIKLIRPEVLGGSGSSGATALQRFEREAQATSELSSPHSIDLYDFGITDDGTFYYVMELLNGIDLRSLIERFGPIPAERAVHILRQACHSLADAHDMGVVHRDIKPGNLFVCRRGSEFDYVKVLDFGLVKHVDEVESATNLTVEGVVSGTPAFMAPEMAVGNPHIDGRADIYALGCVAYWLLTGEIVFEGATPMATILKHATDPPPPPSTRTELAVPAELEAIVMACLEKEPAKRPRDARELAEQLADFSMSTPWAAEQAHHWWATHLPDVVSGGPPPRAG